jgi:menaquinone-9 beta-reductase
MAVGGQRDAAAVSVVVLGGGPAGLAAATALVRAGRAALLHEAGAYPRHRVCGEFLSPDAAPALAALGLADLPERLGAPRSHAARLTASAGGRRLADRTIALDAPAWGLSRWDFDAALAEHARREGVEVREQSRVDALPGDVAGIVATGRLVRAGDHAHAADARTAGAARPAPAWIGVKRHVHGVALGRVTEVHAVAGAYAGLIEVACGGARVVNVCALVRAPTWDRAGRDPEGLWRLLAAESPDFAARWRDAVPVPGSDVATAGFGFAPRGARVGAHALAVGDAAVLTAPFSGAGQSTALASGVAAARCLVAAEDPASASRAWARQLPSDLRRRLAVGDAFQRVLLAPRAAAAVLRLVSVAPAAGRWVFRATRGPLPPA